MLRINELIQETGLSRRTINRLLASGVITAFARDKFNRLHFDLSVVDQLRRMFQLPDVKAPHTIIKIDPASDSVRDGFSPFVFVMEATCNDCGHLFRQHARSVQDGSHTHGCLGCSCRGWRGYTRCIQCDSPLGDCEVTYQFWWNF